MRNPDNTEYNKSLLTWNIRFSLHSIYRLFICLLFLVTPLKSDTISILFENDLFAGTDKHYTNGVRIGWLDDSLHKDEQINYSQLMYKTIDAIPYLYLDPHKKHNAGFSLYQMMFTPQDITATEANYDDIPYTGHLIFSFFLFEYDSNSYDEYKLQFGIVGPLSGAANVQKFFHRLTHSTQPQGWDTQLGNHLTAGITYDHGTRLWQKEIGYGLSSDFIGSYGIQLGNFYTGAAARGVWRVGNNYPDNFNAFYSDVIGDSALLGLQESSEEFGWSVNLGLTLNGIAYFYVTDADTDYNIQRKPYLGDALLSLSFYSQDFELSLTTLIKFSLSNPSVNTLSYGAASLLWKF